MNKQVLDNQMAILGDHMKAFMVAMEQFRLDEIAIATAFRYKPDFDKAWTDRLKLFVDEWSIDGWRNYNLLIRLAEQQTAFENDITRFLN